jgi:hypothetical protein
LVCVNAHKKTAQQERLEKDAEKIAPLLTQGDICCDCQKKNSPFIGCKRQPIVKVKFSHHLFAEAEILTPHLSTQLHSNISPQFSPRKKKLSNFKSLFPKGL